MPVLRTRDTPEEGRISNAIKALENGESKSVWAAHKAFNIPYSKLLGRFRHGTKASHGGQNKALDSAQEESLLQYITFRHEMGRPVKRRQLCVAAESILWNSGQFRQVSSTWITRFD
jgi:Tc5 transposase DNA-binding domain